MKNKGLICFVLSLILVISCMMVSAGATEQEPEQTDPTEEEIEAGTIPQEILDETDIYGCRTIFAENYLFDGFDEKTEKEIENANAIFLYELNSGTLLYERNADLIVEPTELVKIMTALIALEKGDLSDVVTVKAEVLSTIPENSPAVGLVEGEVLSLEDLLYCMVVGAGNDAAAVIADHIGGNQMLFVGQMNAYAEKLGCTMTKFTNVHGIYDPKQSVTARDMAIIFQAAIENEEFCTLFNTSSYTVHATNMSEMRVLLTQNYLKGENNADLMTYMDERVLAGCAGIASDKSRSTIAVAESGSMKLLCAVMGSVDEKDETGKLTTIFGSYQEMSALFDMGFEDYKVFQVLYDNQVLTQKSVLNGDCDLTLGCKESAMVVLPVGISEADLTYTYTYINNDLHAPIEAGEHIADVEVLYGKVPIAQTQLYAMNRVSVRQIQEDTGNHFFDSGKLIDILSVIGICVAAIVVLIVGGKMVQRVRMAIAHNRSRKNRRNRRRSR